MRSAITHLSKSDRFVSSEGIGGSKRPLAHACGGILGFFHFKLL